MCGAMRRFVVTALWLILSGISGTGLADELDLLGDGTLSQFVKANGQPVDSPKWEVSDGVLHMTGGGGGDIFYREVVGDFRLTFQWKISSHGNSGVKYRVQQYGKSWLGCEYQIQDDGTNPLTNQSTAGLYAVYAPGPQRLPNPAGQWNWSQIVVAGNHIEHWLNGTLVVSATVGNEDWLARVAHSKFAQNSDWGQNRTGRIMLQDHGNEVWFRNLKLTRLNERIAELPSHYGLPRIESLGPDFGPQSVVDGSQPQVQPPVSVNLFGSNPCNDCSTEVYPTQRNACRCPPPIRRWFRRRW